MFMATREKKYRWKSIGRELLWWALTLMLAAVVVVLLRVFVFCSFKVPSGSMYPAIEAGDHIIVNKTVPGARVYPHFPRIKIDGKVVTKRYKGVRRIRRNDVIAFNLPYIDGTKMEMNLEVFYVKRCVGLPGDTLRIENGFYRVANAPDAPLGNIAKETELSLTDNSFEILCFPNDTLHYRWNIKNFGPYFIPRAGAKMAIDTINCVLYSKLMEYETDLPVSVDGGRVFLGDSAINAYVFGLNYYFMAGDYVFDSFDSRFWGLVPEDCIIGKAAFVWKSQEMGTGKWRWKRFFKKI
jgi:signal peptidase I